MFYRRVLRMASVLAALIFAPACSAGWPAWDQFAAAFIREDGRVVDWTEQARTVSEGQAYALFFALVAGDRARFELILRWTENNLSSGDLSTRLPAWLWGQDEYARWRVLDPNSAADANLWLAYTLLEAGRLWKRSEYSAQGQALLRQIASAEVREVDDLTVLLPGREGFETEAGTRLNPSYLPPFQLKYLARQDPKGPWQNILDSYLRLLPELTPGGRMADWFVLTPQGPRLDAQTDGRGSYDAVRVYLWAGIGPESMAESRQLRAAVKPFLSQVRAYGRLPERWYPDGRAPVGVAPPGFDAALLPLYTSLAAPDLERSARERLDRARIGGLLGTPARYYDQVLALFGEGYVQRRYRFGPDGRLELDRGKS